MFLEFRDGHVLRVERKVDLRDAPTARGGGLERLGKLHQPGLQLPA